LQTHTGTERWDEQNANCEAENARRFVVRADEKLTAFLGFESATRSCNGFY